MKRRVRVPKGDDVAEEVADLLGREVRRRCGPDSTFEERRAMARQVMAEAMAMALETEPETGAEPEGGEREEV